MPEEISFGGWLRRQRRTLDITRQAFADQVGCAEVTLRRIEGGTLKPSKELAGIILEKLGIPEWERSQWIAFARGVSGFPPSVSSSPNKSLTNLPAQITSFIGREKEQPEVIRLINKHRLVTLAGSGGVGKTRLSIKVGEQVLENYAEGVWLLELASLNDPALLPQTAAALFGLTTQSDIPYIDLLINFLRPKSVLLILDNCEHLLDGCAHFTDALLKSCPDLKILVTSREPLGITGEAIYRVPSLALPDPLKLLDTFRDFESIILFEERAQLAQFNFSLTLDNASSVAQICQRLDGIPLAIELAAAKVGMFTTEQIAKQLDESFNVLTGGSRTDLPHHQTLHASIEWSWNLLTESEQSLMQQLSVFAGGWTLEAAQVVCDGHVFELTDSLVRKSLIMMKREARRETRYRFHETIRQYAHDQLLEVGGRELIRERHLEYCLNLAERAEPELRGPNQITWLDHLQREIDNVRAALDWGLDVKTEAALRIASALLWFWHIRGSKSEGIDWLERALSVHVQELDRAVLSPTRAIIRGKALNAAACLLVLYGNHKRGCQLSEESLALHQELGLSGRRGAACALWNLSQGVSHEDFERAEALTERSLELFQEVDDKFGIAQCLSNLANRALVADNDYGRARALTEESLSLYQEIGDLDGSANMHRVLGLLAFRQGDYEQSRKLYEESLAGFRMVGNKWGIGLALLWLSGVAWEQGNYVKTTRMLEEALALGESLGERSLIAITLDDLGKVAWEQGDYRLATRRFKEELIMSREAGMKSEMAFALHGLGRLAQSRGDYTTARSLYKEALMLCHEISNRLRAAFPLEALAALAAADKQVVQAARFFGAVETLFPAIRFEMSPAERVAHDQVLVAVRAQLGEEAFSEAYQEGKKMSFDRAVDLALKTLEEM